MKEIFPQGASAFHGIPSLIPLSTCCKDFLLFDLAFVLFFCLLVCVLLFGVNKNLLFSSHFISVFFEFICYVSLLVKRVLHVTVAQW